MPLLKISVELIDGEGPEKLRLDRKTSKVWITCPTCGKKDWYYSLYYLYRIEKCGLCQATIGNIFDIDRDLDKRLKFHTKGAVRP